MQKKIRLTILPTDRLVNLKKRVQDIPQPVVLVQQQQQAICFEKSKKFRVMLYVLFNSILPYFLLLSRLFFEQVAGSSVLRI